MKSFRNSLFPIFLISLTVLSCEKVTTEHRQVLDDPRFEGFTNGFFIVHENSIGYYYPDSNKVFPNLFMHQNGRELGNGIHSFGFDTYGPGLATIEKENRIEFVDTKNFLSLGSLELSEPRNINTTYYTLVSFGKRNSGGVAQIDLFQKKIIRTVHTEIEAGKIFVDNEYIYLFSSGRDDKDSVIVRLYGASAGNLHRIDSIGIGNRPVDFVVLSLDKSYDHRGLAILCLGRKSVPPSIVTLDLITGKVKHVYQFEDTELKPENIFWIFQANPDRQILACYSKNKLYRLELSDPIQSSVLINKNISSLTSTRNNFIAVSRDTIHQVSFLYKIDLQTFKVLDSITIEPKAKKIEGNQ
jgi:hypothetical protein